MSINKKVVIQTLLQHGPTTTGELVAMTGMNHHELSRTLRRWAMAGLYGVYRSDTVKSEAGDGPPRNIWSIERHAAEIALCKTPAQPRPPRQVPQYTGPFRTQWQASSPYYQEAA